MCSTSPTTRCAAGMRLDDIEIRRNDAVFLDGSGRRQPARSDHRRGLLPPLRREARSWPCRRRSTGPGSKVWSRSGPSFCGRDGPHRRRRFDRGHRRASPRQGWTFPTTASGATRRCSSRLANTKEPLYLRPSRRQPALPRRCRPPLRPGDRALPARGFTDILLRGDTDFSLTADFDRWDDDGVRFVFGYDAKANLVEAAEGQPDELYHELAGQGRAPVRDRPRTRPGQRERGRSCAERGYKNDPPRRRGARRVLLPTRALRAGLPDRRAAEEPLDRARPGRAVRRSSATSSTSPTTASSPPSR